MQSTTTFQNAKVGELVDRFKHDRRLTHYHIVGQKAPQYADYPSDLDPELIAIFQKHGIERLYSHQREAIDAVRAGKNVVTVTPTASGKTLCYNVPVFQSILENPNTRALYLFPTKALSQDQMDEIHTLGAEWGKGIRCFTYDGDTPQDARRRIRTDAQIVVSNPDMLHQGILPHHTKWLSFFENLRFVIIDEMHCYRGVLGSHFANLMRRLKRIAAFYRAAPQFILSSATIANPSALAESLTETKITLIDKSGAPRGEKHFFFINPPIVDEQLGIRANALHVARSVARATLDQKLQTIIFTTSRLNVEILVKYLKDTFEQNIQDRGRIRGYRGGYLPNARREIEKGLRRGAVRGVVSTNALELGVDIGGLDAAILAGYPGTIASTWQQSGRAGRNRSESVAFLIARSNPLDQYIIEHPEYFFGASPEHGLINSDNLPILMSHIKCAAFELPFQDGETFGAEDLSEILAYLEQQKVLHHSGGKWHWMNDAYPADQVSLRSANAENIVITDLDAGGKPIAEVDLPSAPFFVHPKAIYMLEHTPYVVEQLDFENRQAYVRKADGDYYTEAIDSTHVRILDIFETRNDLSTRTEHGEVHVLTHISGFKKVKFYSLENLGYGKVELPDQEMHTTSYWFTVPPAVVSAAGLGRDLFVTGLMGVGYALHYLATLILMCDLRDIHRSVGDRQAKWFLTQTPEGKGMYTHAVDDHQENVALDELDLFEPTVFLYDNYPGGVGFGPVLFEHHRTLLLNARAHIRECACTNGCPSCVGPVIQASNQTKYLAIKILDVLLRPSHTP